MSILCDFKFDNTKLFNPRQGNAFDFTEKTIDT